MESSESISGALTQPSAQVLTALRHLVNGATDISHCMQGLELQLLRMQASLDLVPAPIFFKDRQGTYQGCNKAFLDCLGLRPEQVMGKTVHDIAPPELARMYETADNALLSEGGTQTYEAKVRYADGTLHHVAFFRAVLPDRDGGVAGLVGVMFDITARKHLEEDLERLAATDALTGLYNRRMFFRRAEEEFSRALRERLPLSLLIVDVDFFKQINDRFGHAAGDRTLQALAAAAQQMVRHQDVLARIGGEEFAVLLPNTQGEKARSMGERLLGGLAALDITAPGDTFRFTVSAGLTEGRPEHETFDQALNRADRALYRAKALGRNRLELD